MAETTTTAPAASEKSAEAPAKAPTAKEAAKMFANVKVRVFDLDENGKPKVEVINEETKETRKVVVVRKITAADVLATRLENGAVIMVTCDGRKYRDGQPYEAAA